ncbi:MAG: hypothetical protein K5683_03390 [Prevotella sp.]|nr:hypothetical protein [Prevotella sp.]
MRKGLSNWMIIATALVGMNMGFTSCSDDDDDKDQQQQEQAAQQQQDTFWDVVGQLAGQSAFTADYQNATFEPIIGQPLSESNTYVRVVPTNDMATAAMRFASLVNKSDIDENTTSYNWHDDAVGTLIYKKTTDGTSLATVDVDIKQMPHLQQIIYRTPEQSGQNGSFKGTAYYRFGDVIKRSYYVSKNSIEEHTDVWICVRPAFGPEGKEDSHWISISPLPKENLWTKQTDGFSYELPTDLGSNKEHMQNFAEMLFAITHPDTWETNLEVAKTSRASALIMLLGSPIMFHDFDTKNMKYHSKEFWKRVAKAWESQGVDIWRTLFGMTNKAAMKELLDNHGLFLLHKGKWWTFGSSYFSLYQASYKNGAGKKSNMHEAEFKTVENKTTNVGNFIISELCKDTSPSVVHKFFGDEIPRFVVRYATGKELAGSTPSVYTSLAGSNNGVEDLYVYNKFYKITVSPATTPETEEDIQNEGKPTESTDPINIPKIGQVLSTDGRVYSSYKTSIGNDRTAAGLICYVRTSDDDKVDESTFNSCLAIGYLPIEEKLEWGVVGNTQTTASQVCGKTIDQDSQYAAFLNMRNGYSITKKLVEEYTEGNNQSHNHKAARACWNYWDTEFDLENAPSVYVKDHWHLPSVGQWHLFLMGLGAWDVSTNGTEVENAIKKVYVNAGITETIHMPLSGTYWTSTEKNADQAYVLVIDNKDGAHFEARNKNEAHTVFPFITVSDVF